MRASFRMTAADLVFIDVDGAIVERVPGYLLEDGGLAWRASAQCQFERDALDRVFAGLERMHLARQAVTFDLATGRARHAIRGVDRAGQRLHLRAGPGG